MAESIVSQVTNAPAKAFTFTKNHLIAAAVLALVVLWLGAMYEKRNPGKIRAFFSGWPLIGGTV